MLEIFQYAFIQKALISGISLSVLCSIIGLFLVLRRQALFGDALSHMAFGGIAVGIYSNIYPLWTAFILSIVASISITKIRQITNLPSDSLIAVLLSFGFSLGVILISLSNGFSVDLFSFLFGSILLVNNTDIVTIILSTISIAIITKIFFKKFMYLSFDEDQAKASGLSVSKLNYLFVTMVAVTVIVSMKLAGILLISSLLVLPNLSALLLGYGFKKTLLISIIISISCVFFGILLSYALDLAPSGTVVMALVGIFIGIFFKKGLFKNYASINRLRNMPHH